MILLTSFEKSKEYSGTRFSVARWQPQGFNYPTLDFLSARDRNKQPLRLRQFPANPLQEYAASWLGFIESNYRKVHDWINKIPIDDLWILCCWCPYQRSTQEQIRRFGTFACHTGLIGQLIRKNRKDLLVVLDDDREQMLVPEWK